MTFVGMARLVLSILSLKACGGLDIAYWSCTLDLVNERCSCHSPCGLVLYALAGCSTFGFTCKAQSPLKHHHQMCRNIPLVAPEKMVLSPQGWAIPECFLKAKCSRPRIVARALVAAHMQMVRAEI
ncbi:hypothetical protein K458DRAFT_117288 [Lentithecium fluviatile CBS 122367]|uniref:MYND-type zinc finger protein samB n=1 Tax=Lentithecium fluviatile CBS 122367 TaxID=1168545 RepID=A0A6G1IMN0_9PLEO|nr:hypothetical protein K458DRAFT_117288 [Lentithecium fluviatile CBS 122367]